MCLQRGLTLWIYTVAANSLSYPRPKHTGLEIISTSAPLIVNEAVIPDERDLTNVRSTGHRSKSVPEERTTTPAVSCDVNNLISHHR